MASPGPSEQSELAPPGSSVDRADKAYESKQ